MEDRTILAGHGKMRPVSFKDNSRSFNDCPNQCVDDFLPKLISKELSGSTPAVISW